MLETYFAFLNVCENVRVCKIICLSNVFLFTKNVKVYRKSCCKIDHLKTVRKLGH